MEHNKDKYSHIQVSGDGIMPVIRAITAEALCNVLLSKYELENVQKGQFYPMYNYLKLLHDINKRMPNVLKAIGEFICQETILPPKITSFEQILMTLDKVYYMNHLGNNEDEIGHWQYEKQSDTDYFMHDSKPYPCIFSEGILTGFANKFNVKITLTHVDEKCRNKGDQQCIYHIHIDR